MGLKDFAQGAYEATFNRVNGEMAVTFSGIGCAFTAPLLGIAGLGLLIKGCDESSIPKKECICISTEGYKYPHPSPIAQEPENVLE